MAVEVPREKVERRAKQLLTVCQDKRKKISKRGNAFYASLLVPSFSCSFSLFSLSVLVLFPGTSCHWLASLALGLTQRFWVVCIHPKLQAGGDHCPWWISPAEHFMAQKVTVTSEESMALSASCSSLTMVQISCHWGHHPSWTARKIGIKRWKKSIVSSNPVLCLLRQSHREPWSEPHWTPTCRELHPCPPSLIPRVSPLILIMLLQCLVHLWHFISRNCCATNAA